MIVSKGNAKPRRGGAEEEENDDEITLPLK